jgi:hypothetical protein
MTVQWSTEEHDTDLESILPVEPLARGELEMILIDSGLVKRGVAMGLAIGLLTICVLGLLLWRWG